ncbi:hypothetical protein JQX13_15530 [Archangium violaceum]|uniref:hypothetical protein n=1 Tax=Archangium violaceum TaxID=83451 RepID=UPI00193B06AB|nr:hypothetical protein [Archangium violaceum]QRK11354.1 hypothetical protein JQX13_15530 [Archangium violaceum]
MFGRAVVAAFASLSLIGCGGEVFSGGTDASEPGPNHDAGTSQPEADAGTPPEVEPDAGSTDPSDKPITHFDVIIGTGSGQIHLPSGISGVNCGDVVGIRAGTYYGIGIVGVNGCAGNPITIANHGGQVKVVGTQQGNWGISFENSSHVVFRSAVPGEYGFYVRNSVGRGGFEVSGTSHDMEISGVHVAEAAHGIMIKEDPRCSRPKAWHPFVMRNFVVKNNRFENTLWEGTYFGFHNAESMTMSCNGSDVQVKAARLANVKTLNNIFRNNGNNAIKVRLCLEGCETAYNDVYGYALNKDTGWDSGITYGYETYGSIHHNRVERGYGNAIEIIGRVQSTIKIHDNTIVSPGTMPDGSKGQTWARGIAADFRSTGMRVEIFDNSISNPIAGDVSLTNYENLSGVTGKVCNSGSRIENVNVQLDACP